MNSKPAVLGRSRRTRVFTVLAALGAGLVATMLLSGFHVGVRELGDAGDIAVSELTTPEVIGIRTFTAPSGIQVTEDVTYGTRDDGTLLTLDVCRPAEAVADTTAAEAVQAEAVPAEALPADAMLPDAALPDSAVPDATLPEAPLPGGQAPAVVAAQAGLPAVVSIHGGSWARGDKANDDWRNVCQWLASEGFVAYSLNYRLVPEALFPAAIDDVALAVEWMRTPANASRFGIDPARIGAFGGSAGGNLAALLGTRGTGPLDEGSRVAAVAELSAPTDLRREAVLRDGGNELLQTIITRYLGCEEWTLCPQAEDASPSTFVDRSDPPFFIGHAASEFIPLAQAQNFAGVLDAAGIGVEYAVVPGDDHSIGILDEAMRARVAAFLHAELG
ncbi:MAG: alpha/beta hydrolase [Microterricola sp.]